MTDRANSTVPVWALLTTDVAVPALAGGEPMTPKRLNDLRTALAALAQTPIATLEVHPLPSDLDTSDGIRLARTSPLAQQLTQLIADSAQSSSESPMSASMEALFRMVVPSEAAAQIGGGLVRPKPKKASGARRQTGPANPLAGVAGLADLVPAAGGAGMAPVVAGSLVLVAVAAGILGVVDGIDRQLKGIAELLDKLHEDALETERVELDSSRPAITKATAILLDRGRIGEMIAVGGAVTNIDKAITAANRRLARWQHALENFPKGRVEFPKVRQAFKGIDDPAGEFHAHLELALLAIDLKRRVLLLQAVEQAQNEPENPLERFMNALHHDQQSLEELSAGINEVLVRLSTLEVDRTHGMRDFMFTSGEVDDLLRTSHHLRALNRYADSESSQAHSDVEIEIARNADGSIVVFPAVEA